MVITWNGHVVYDIINDDKYEKKYIHGNNFNKRTHMDQIDLAQHFLFPEFLTNKVLTIYKVFYCCWLLRRVEFFMIP